MKKILLIALIAFGMNAKAQITLEHYYPTGSIEKDYLRLIKLSSSGYKYAINDTSTITLYNLNHSVFKTMTIPITLVVSNPNAVFVFYISEELFNTNPSDVEYFVYYSDAAGISHSMVCDELGSILFSADSTDMTYESGYGEENFISYTTLGVKMIIWKSDIAGGGASVYSLPGSLVCEDCSGGTISSKIPQSGVLQNENISNPYPNPNNNSTKIDYELPQGINEGEIVFYNLQGAEVKRFKVDRTFNTLLISTQDLAAGTYLYQLQTSAQSSEGKKMVVIK